MGVYAHVLFVTDTTASAVVPSNTVTFAMLVSDSVPVNAGSEVTPSPTVPVSCESAMVVVVVGGVSSSKMVFVLGLTRVLLEPPLVMTTWVMETVPSSNGLKLTFTWLLPEKVPVTVSVPALLLKVTTAVASGAKPAIVTGEAGASAALIRPLASLKVMVGAVTLSAVLPLRGEFESERAGQSAAGVVPVLLEESASTSQLPGVV